MKPMLSPNLLDVRGRRCPGLSLLCACSIMLFAAAAEAGDGRIEINQARAVAGGVSSEDTPGFPVNLDGNQSYVLTSDLDAGPGTGILVSGLIGTKDNFTLDLNGFSIRGSGVGSAIGINSTGGNTEIKNGTIHGFGGRGLLLQTSGRQVVRNLRVVENGEAGIQSNGAAFITDCFIHGNGGSGLQLGSSSYVARNRVANNGGIGIDVGSGSYVESNLVLHGNSAAPAVDLGTLTGQSSAGYRNNLINNSPAGGTVVGGNDMGGNLCNGSTTCP